MPALHPVHHHSRAVVAAQRRPHDKSAASSPPPPPPPPSMPPEKPPPSTTSPLSTAPAAAKTTTRPPASSTPLPVPSSTAPRESAQPSPTALQTTPSTSSTASTASTPPSQFAETSVAPPTTPLPTIVAPLTPSPASAAQSADTQTTIAPHRVSTGAVIGAAAAGELLLLALLIFFAVRCRRRRVRSASVVGLDMEQKGVSVSVAELQVPPRVLDVNVPPETPLTATSTLYTRDPFSDVFAKGARLPSTPSTSSPYADVSHCGDAEVDQRGAAEGQHCSGAAEMEPFSDVELDHEQRSTDDGHSVSSQYSRSSYRPTRPATPTPTLATTSQTTRPSSPAASLVDPQQVTRSSSPTTTLFSDSTHPFSHAAMDAAPRVPSPRAISPLTLHISLRSGPVVRSPRTTYFSQSHSSARFTMPDSASHASAFSHLRSSVFASPLRSPALLSPGTASSASPVSAVPHSPRTHARARSAASLSAKERRLALAVLDTFPVPPASARGSGPAFVYGHGRAPSAGGTVLPRMPRSAPAWVGAFDVGTTQVMVAAHVVAAPALQIHAPAADALTSLKEVDVPLSAPQAVLQPPLTPPPTPEAPPQALLPKRVLSQPPHALAATAPASARVVSVSTRLVSRVLPSSTPPPPVPNARSVLVSSSATPPPPPPPLPTSAASPTRLPQQTRIVRVIRPPAKAGPPPPEEAEVVESAAPAPQMQATLLRPPPKAALPPTPRSATDKRGSRASRTLPAKTQSSFAGWTPLARSPSMLTHAGIYSSADEAPPLPTPLTLSVPLSPRLRRRTADSVLLIGEDIPPTLSPRLLPSPRRPRGPRSPKSNAVMLIGEDASAPPSPYLPPSPRRPRGSRTSVSATEAERRRERMSTASGPVWSMHAPPVPPTPTSPSAARRRDAPVWKLTPSMRVTPVVGADTADSPLARRRRERARARADPVLPRG